MFNKIFINLPIENLTKSVDFFTALGFTFNPQFTDEQGTCMIVAEKAFELGAKRVNDPEDHGFMFSWAFEDLDGHSWDLFWMNPEHVQG